MRFLKVAAVVGFFLVTGGTSLFADDLRIDGSSEVAFERSLQAIAATISAEDKEAFDRGFAAIFADRYLKLDSGGAKAGVAAMNGVTKEELLAAGRGVIAGTVSSADSLAEIGWQYSSHTDDMTGQPSRSAYISSSKPFEFSAPYTGEQYAILSVRHHPREGLDVMLRIEKGQFACAVAECAVSVRFDEGPIQTVEVTAPTDMDNTIRFVRKPEPFLHALKESKSVRIEATFYNEGNRVFEFRTAGLKHE
ncbi:hypothetical protein [Ensifer sp.]|uniref:hypothetical protein n=1 Tax=Ensifer sp. TaxID=1872086 RepID=UPI00289FF418|nr:hypothetical protein [Ensifer sp.]